MKSFRDTIGRAANENSFRIVGAGTWIFSFIAAEAGVKRAYTIEFAGIADWAKEGDKIAKAWK